MIKTRHDRKLSTYEYVESTTKKNKKTKHHATREDKIKTFKKEPKRMLFSYKNKIYRLEAEAYNRAFDIRESLETMTLGDAFKEMKNK